MDWTQGTALLISNKPIAIPAEADEISDNLLTSYVGGYGFTCTYKIQNIRIINCKQDLYYNCYDLYQFVYPRYGCEFAESGSCTEEFMKERVAWPCIDREGYEGICTYIPEEVVYFYILACK